MCVVFTVQWNTGQSVMSGMYILKSYRTTSSVVQYVCTYLPLSSLELFGIRLSASLESLCMSGRCIMRIGDTVL